jgi:hypothetical protein
MNQPVAHQSFQDNSKYLSPLLCHCSILSIQALLSPSTFGFKSANHSYIASYFNKLFPLFFFAIWAFLYLLGIHSSPLMSQIQTVYHHHNYIFSLFVLKHLDSVQSSHHYPKVMIFILYRFRTYSIPLIFA